MPLGLLLFNCISRLSEMEAHGDNNGRISQRQCSKSACRFDSTSKASQLRSNSKLSSRSFKVAVKEAAQSWVTCLASRPKHDAKDAKVNSTSQESFSGSDSPFIRNTDHYFRSGSQIGLRRTQSEIKIFSMDQISKATGNFSKSSVIGKGSFGIVYRGKLSDGSIVAIKCRKMGVGKQIWTEMMNEIDTLSRVEHFNLVRLYGYLVQDGEPIIVSEYVGNGDLREHLNGSRGDDMRMGERLQIAIDIASALTYLHGYTDQPIVHRDIKASNILITENYRAKVGDFGFARLMEEDFDGSSIETGVKGSHGYLDPVYLTTCRLTEKSDVYSFGVLLMELVTGRAPMETVQETNITRNNTEWAMKKYNGGEIEVAMDRKLARNKATTAVAEGMFAVAQRCLAPTRRSRPSMKQCGEALWKLRGEFHRLTPSVSSTSTSLSENPSERGKEGMNSSEEIVDSWGDTYSDAVGSTEERRGRGQSGSSAWLNKCCIL